jgi:competence CoiA-like predicted nuclease
MPLIGFDKRTASRLDITTIEDPRSFVSKGDLVCPFCMEPMVVVFGMQRIKHFRHINKCTDNTPLHPESMRHLLGKLYVKHLLLDSRPDLQVDFEVRLPEIGRVADVFVQLDGGWQEVHEIQLASITTEELCGRTKSYHSAGISVTWWLGGKATTPANTRWIEDTFGSYRTLVYERGQLPPDA